VTFVDQFGRMVYLCLIKAKSDVFLVFKKFKEMVERQCGKKLQILIIDGGGEYMSKEFREYCTKFSIQHESATPYT